MKINDVYSLIEQEMKDVDSELINNLDSEVEMVNDVASYVFESGGKRLRPVFLVLAAKLAGYTGDRSSVLSGVVEYIHTATLIHDDVIDGAKFRRGRESVNRVFGNDITVLCGDFLYSRAFVNLVRDGDSNIQLILANAAKTMSEGEVFQLIKTADFFLKFEDYEKIIFSKTAVLFSACCEIGGILGGLSEEKTDALKKFGKFVGLAFQMSDDILDYLGDPDNTGKNPGTDLREGKMTLPMILLRQCLKNDEIKTIRDIFTNEDYSEKNLEYILTLMQNKKIKEKAEKFVDDYIFKAKELLNVFDDNHYKNSLLFLADYVVQRDR